MTVRSIAREQAAAPLAVESLGQFEIAAGGGIDLHHRAVGEAARRREARQLALLRQLDVVDQRAGGGDLGAAEGAEPVERADAVERAPGGGAAFSRIEAGRRAAA